MAVTVDRYDVAIARDGDDVYALQDLCSHAAVQAQRGRGRRLHDRVLAARLDLRPAHRQADHLPGDRAGRHLPRRST
nr:Rieske 2Fe-2S domain-containing protein [Nocardioides convexus]